MATATIGRNTGDTLGGDHQFVIQGEIPPRAGNAMVTLPSPNNGYAGILFRFPVTSIPAGSTVTDAWIEVKRTDGAGTFAFAYVFRIFEVDDWIHDQATYLLRKTGVSWSHPEIAPVDNLIDGDGESIPPDATLSLCQSPGFTSLVQSWVNGTQVNQGVIYVNVGNDVTFAGFGAADGNRPKLVVQYTPPAGVTVAWLTA